MLLMIVPLSWPGGASLIAASPSHRPEARLRSKSSPTSPKSRELRSARRSISATTASSRSIAACLECDSTERRWRLIVLHHSATDSGSVASIDRNHRTRNDAAGRAWLGIGYHFVIGNGHDMEDGEIQLTFRWRQQLAGAHAGQRRANEEGIGICLIGNFEQHRPTARQIDSATKLIAALADRYDLNAAQVKGHDAVRATRCPGRYFPLEQLKLAINDAELRASPPARQITVQPAHDRSLNRSTLKRSQ